MFGVEKLGTWEDHSYDDSMTAGLSGKVRVYAHGKGTRTAETGTLVWSKVEKRVQLQFCLIVLQS